MKQGMGMIDRVEDHDMVFDVEGMTHVARQRSVEMDQNQRLTRAVRNDRGCVWGYKGRERGEGDLGVDDDRLPFSRFP